MGKNLTPFVLIFTIITIGIIYYFITSKFIYVHCDKQKKGMYGVYAFNKNEFKWLYNSRTQKFKYKKDVITFNKDEATYAPGTVLGNGQKITVNRLSGTVTFSWKFKGKNQSQTEKCEKIKKLPKLEAKF